MSILYKYNVEGKYGGIYKNALPTVNLVSINTKLAFNTGTFIKA